jgi:acetyl esterase/lipase
MNLGSVSLVDCAVFVLFLVPQLILQAGLLPTLTTTLKALPFVLFTLPTQLVQARWRTQHKNQVDDVKRLRLSFFQDVVLRCVKWAFKNVPFDVARVFFARQVAMPFLWFRILRHGYRSFPAHLREISMGEGVNRFKGVWIRKDPDEAPDIVVYYIHGGGFALGSSYFYLEFLLQWCALLDDAGYCNPALFSLEYTLAPDARYPIQMNEAIAAYEHVLEVASDPSRVCLGADSAGATLILSMSLELAGRRGAYKASANGHRPKLLPKPQLAVLISPWPSLMMRLHKNTDTDYLDKLMLWKYAHQYAGTDHLHRSPANPGSCRDDELWRRAAPCQGFFVISGGQEVLVGDVRDFVSRQRSRGIAVESIEVAGQPHAWAVASLFLGDSVDERLEGLLASL